MDSMRILATALLLVAMNGCSSRSTVSYDDVYFVANMPELTQEEFVIDDNCLCENYIEEHEGEGRYDTKGMPCPGNTSTFYDEYYGE